MSGRRQIPENIQNQVRQRANCLCEYCHASEQWQYVEFTIEHIIPLTKSGTNDIDNLALACFHCNRKKCDRHCDRRRFDGTRHDSNLARQPQFPSRVRC
jgi:5-methylcytosine-specific restriction endonuclease McrA